MNVIKILEKIVKSKNEIREVRQKLEHVERELDAHVAEMIEFLRFKRIIESKES
jgi:tetrahydromethanopterin S-methyltransferase subunit G